eukprot:18801-Chlamydomonas_euryale.AAC.2
MSSFVGARGVAVSSAASVGSPTCCVSGRMEAETTEPAAAASASTGSISSSSSSSNFLAQLQDRAHLQQHWHQLRTAVIHGCSGVTSAVYPLNHHHQHQQQRLLQHRPKGQCIIPRCCDART